MKPFVKVIGLLIFCKRRAMCLRLSGMSLLSILFVQLHASRSFAFLRFVGISKQIDTTMNRATLWEKMSDPVSRRKPQRRKLFAFDVFSIITATNDLCVQERSTPWIFISSKITFSSFVPHLHYHLWSQSTLLPKVKQVVRRMWMERLRLWHVTTPASTVYSVTIVNALPITSTMKIF